MNTFPENCVACEYYKICQSFFGARGCKYEREIVNAILERERQHEEKID